MAYTVSHKKKPAPKPASQFEALSLSILLLGANWRSPRSRGRLGRGSGILWLTAFVVYATVMVYQEIR